MQLFGTLIESCLWPQNYFENNPNSRIAILFDNNVDSSYMLSVATFPRKPTAAADRYRIRSATSRYGELLQWACQIVADPGTISAKTYSPRLIRQMIRLQ